MNFNFEVEEKILRQKKSHKKCGKETDSIFCSFTFTTSEWKYLEKYVVFWDRDGTSYVRYLGKGKKVRCPIPKEILQDLYFTVQVYANDEVFTTKLKVFVKEDIPIKDDSYSKKMINMFFEKMEHKIDNIVYDDNKLLIYANNKLIKTINIADEALFRKIFSEGAPEYIVDTLLSETSSSPVANKTIYRALEEKLDKTSVAPVAYTGSYNDLTDIPEEFPPAAHQHMSDDIVNLDSSLNEEVDDFIDELIEQL